MAVELIKNKDGTFSLNESCKFYGWSDEEFIYNMGDHGNLQDYVKYVVATEDDYGYKTDVNIYRNTLKNHKEVITFKVDCQTMAIPKSVINELVELDWNNLKVSSRKDSKIEAVVSVVIRGQSVSTNYNSNTPNKPKDGKTAFDRTIEVTKNTVKDTDYLLFKYGSYGFICNSSDLELIVNSESKKYKLVEA